MNLGGRASQLSRSKSSRRTGPNDPLFSNQRVLRMRRVSLIIIATFNILKAWVEGLHALCRQLLLMVLRIVKIADEIA